MYSDITLSLLGVLGIAIHCLVKIQQLKKDGKPISLSAYIDAEWATMALSICAITIVLICKREIPELEAAGNYLGLGFVSVGYFGQSILVFLLGRVGKVIGAKEDGDSTTK